MTDERLITFWQQSGLDGPLPEAWYFCDTPECADELAALVLAGTKTATCGSLWATEADGDPVPRVGDWSIITRYDGTPVCVIETTEVTIRPFNAVDAQFAYDEGEGDRTWAYWHAAHTRFFTREFTRLGLTLADDMPLICERFRVIYKP